MKSIIPNCEGKVKVMKNNNLLLCAFPKPTAFGGSRKIQDMIQFNVNLEQYKFQ